MKAAHNNSTVTSPTTKSTSVPTYQQQQHTNTPITNTTITPTTNTNNSNNNNKVYARLVPRVGSHGMQSAPGNIYSTLFRLFLVSSYSTYSAIHCARRLHEIIIAAHVRAFYSTMWLPSRRGRKKSHQGPSNKVTKMQYTSLFG